MNILGGLITNIGTGIIRHIATGSGIWLVQHGWLVQSDTDKYLGSVIFLGGVALSALSKLRNHQITKGL